MTNWYVRQNGGSYGNQNGTDWINAFNGFLGINWNSISCGDTIWIAGGNYTDSLQPSKVCTNESRLYIRRARIDAPECTETNGWNPIYAANINHTGGIRLFASNKYITFSGRTSTNGGNNGWYINFSGVTTGGNGIVFGHGDIHNDYLTFEYMDLQGPGPIYYTQDGRAIDGTPSLNIITGNIFSHMKIWNWESAIYNVGMSFSLYEYLDVSDIGTTNWEFHPNGIIAWGSDNVIIRWSKWHTGANNYGVGEGIFIEQSGGCDNWKIYGNIFYNQKHTGKNIEITANIIGMKIWNNTFYNNNFDPISFGPGISCGTGSEFKNNLSIMSGSSSCGITTNNIQLNSPNPFVNSDNEDFHIVDTIGDNYPRNAGIDLSTHFITDMDGNAFGGDGTWDIGAFGYVSNGDCPTPIVSFTMNII